MYRQCCIQLFQCTRCSGVLPEYLAFDVNGSVGPPEIRTKAQKDSVADKAVLFNVFGLFLAYIGISYKILCDLQINHFHL